MINVNDLNLLGRHNYENVMAATAMSVNFGVPMEKIVEVLKRWTVHRTDSLNGGIRVGSLGIVVKTDPSFFGHILDPVFYRLETLLIGGGYDKQSTYDEWIDAFDGKVKKLVLIGQTAEKISSPSR